MRDIGLRPITVLLLGIPIALFLGALLSDLAYSRTYEVQWANFAAWLISGALVGGGIVLAIAVVHFFRHRGEGGRAGLFLLLVAAMWIVGFINALIHARDGWAMMPTGLILSLVVFVLSLAAAWAGLSGTRRVEAN